MFGLTASADQSAVTELVWSVGVILDVILLLPWIVFWISAGSLSTVLLAHRGSISFCSGHCRSVVIVSKHCFLGQNADVGAG